MKLAKIEHFHPRSGVHEISLNEILSQNKHRLVEMHCAGHKKKHGSALFNQKVPLATELARGLSILEMKADSQLAIKAYEKELGLVWLFHHSRAHMFSRCLYEARASLESTIVCLL